MDCSDTRRAFAEKRCSYLLRLSNLCRQCGSHRMSRSHANNGVDAQHTNADVRDMHRTPLAMIGPRRLSVEFRHHAVHFHTLCDAVTVPAMRRRNPVRWLERCAHAYGASLLACVIVDGPDRHSGLDKPLQTLLKFPDECQVLIHPEQFFARRERLRESRRVSG